MQVIKRDGTIEEYSVEKIIKAISKAFKSCNKELDNDTEEIFRTIFKQKSDKELQVEDIQNRVENLLMTEGFCDVAKAYIIYREQHKKLREFTEKKKAFIERFINADNTANATIDDNSNVSTHNVAVLNSEIHKEENREINLRLLRDKLHLLYPKFDVKQMDKDLSTIAYLHDSSSQVGMPYCVAITMYPFLLNGLKDIGGLSVAPKNIDSFCGMFVNLVFAIASQFKGACMHYSQNLIIDHKKQNIKEFVDSNTDWVPFNSDDQSWEFAIPKEQHFITEEKKDVLINKVYRRKYSGKMYKVQTKKGFECTVTKDHIFKTLYKGNIKNVTAEKLSLHDTVFINADYSNYLDTNSIEYKRNFCLGMLLGDGCLSKENAVILSITPGLECYFDTFNEYSNEVFGNSLHLNKGHKCWNAQKMSKEYKEKICSYLSGKYTIDKNIKPEYLTTIDECCGFLDGLMSTDGAYRHAYGLSLINKGLIDSCIKVLSFLNVPFTLSETPEHDNKKRLYNLSFSSCAKVYLPNFIKKCPAHKGSNFIYYISCKSKYRTTRDEKDIDTSRRGQNKWGKVAELDVITSIESFDNDHPYVYEIETESHWYSCGGIITHNCATPGVLLSMDWYLRKEWGEHYNEKKDVIISNEHCSRKQTIHKQIHQYFQQICYSLMQPAGSRGNQSVFWNLSIFDKPFFDTMYGDFYFPDNTKPNWKTFNWLQKDFLHWLNQERLKCILTFPVVSVCLIYQNHEFLDKELADYAAKEYSEGNSFFTFISDSAESLSSCCRLSSKLAKPQFNFTNGQLSEMTGSKNVITLNLNRIIQDCDRAFGIRQHGGWTENTSFIRDYLKEILERIYKYQTAYNECLKDLYKAGLLTVYSAGFIDMKKQYLTIGINGLNQAAEYLGMKCNKNEEYEKFCNYIFSTIKEQNTKHRTKELMFNTEFTPCESAAIKLYNKDKEDGYKVPTDTNLYASYIFKPNDSGISILDKLYLHGRNFCGDNLDGGSAAHINLDSHLSKVQYDKILKYAAEVGCKYFTFNVPNSECQECGYITKVPITECPKCHSHKIDYYDRVIGYLTRISNWSKGRQTEQKTRIYSKGKEEIK